MRYVMVCKNDEGRSFELLWSNDRFGLTGHPKKMTIISLSY